MRTAKMMEKKYIKKIESIINHPKNYTVDQVVDWWLRVYPGQVDITGQTITFSVDTVDRRYQMVYQRPIW